MSSLFPTDTPSSPTFSETVSNQPAYGRNVKFDFEQGEFILSPTGRQQWLSDTDAWLEWCIKALSTSRYDYLAYSQNYGEEFIELIGKSMSREVAESEIRRITIECLMVDSRTAKATNFVYEWLEDAVVFSCTISNTLGETRHIGGRVVV